MFFLCVVAATPACGSLFGIGDLPPLPPSDDAAATPGAEGGTGSEVGAPVGDGGASSEAGPLPQKTGDPRWPLWPIPDDAPPKNAYTIGHGTDGKLVVTDTKTGITWQDTLGPTDPHYDPKRCEDLVYADHDDWRAPTRVEMASLLYYGDAGLVPQPPVFSLVTDTSACFFTASTTKEGDTPVWTYDDTLQRAPSARSCYTRCVRDVAPLGNHTRASYDVDTDSVLDIATGLVWERTPPTELERMDATAARCAAMTLRGKQARMPRVKELLSIIDDQAYDPAFDPAMGKLEDFAWSTTITNEGQWWVSSLSGNSGFLSAGSTASGMSRCVAGP